jgi:hypothetical protein
MANVCELTYEVEPNVPAIEPILDEPPGDEKSPSRPVRVIASVGAWLVERFANVPGPIFIEDGRLAACSRELRAPIAAPEATSKLVH